MTTGASWLLEVVMRRMVVLGLVVAGCSTDPSPSSPPPVAPPVAIAPTPMSAPAPVSHLVESNAFDSARSRDPFVPGVVAAPPPIVRDELDRKARRFTLDDLKLVAVVGGDRAMLVDPRGKGWVVSRGDHVGRPEITDHVAGWRVEKVRKDDVVFVKEDATRTDREGEKRVIALRSETPPIDFVDD